MSRPTCIFLSVIITLALSMLTGCDASQATQPVQMWTPMRTSTPTSTSTSTLINVPSLTPTPALNVTIRNLDDQYPNGIFEFDPSFGNISSGTYILQFESENMVYISLDGTQTGMIGKVVEIPGYSQGNYDYIGDHSFTPSFEDPGYMSVNVKRIDQSLNGENIKRILEMRIRSVTLQSREQHIWVADFQRESGVICSDMSLSPNHEWIVGDCVRDGEYYLYFLNIREETFRLYHSPENPCLQETSRDGWAHYNWASNGEWVIAECPASESFFACLVSSRTGEFSCPGNPDVLANVFVYSWSPDGNMVAVKENDYFVIEDRTCLEDAHSCQKYIQAPITHTLEYVMLSVVWGWDGKTVVWSYYDVGVDYSGYALICTGVIETKEYNCFDGPKGANIWSISPDGEWLAIGFEDTDGLPATALLSIDGEVLRRLPWSLGWLVIP